MCPAAQKKTGEAWAEPYAMFYDNCTWPQTKELAEEFGMSFYDDLRNGAYLLPQRMKKPSSFFVFVDSLRVSGWLTGYTDHVWRPREAQDGGGMYAQHLGRANVGHADGHVGSYNRAEAEASPMNVTYFLSNM